MPDIGAIGAGSFVPPHPFHFLTIIRYVSILFVLFIYVSPRESGGLVFMLMLGATALLMVADIYGAEVIERRFTIFLIRVMAVVIPIILAGTGTEKTTRQTAILVALMGMPSVGITLFMPFLDPSLG